MTKLGDKALLAFAALVLTATAACGGMRSGADGPTARIIVDNNHGPLGTVQIWVVPEVGTRRLLGNVGAARVDTLTFSVPVGGGQYRLRAEPPTGGRITSQPFRFLAGPTIVRWDLGQNSIFISEP